MTHRAIVRSQPTCVRGAAALLKPLFLQDVLHGIALEHGKTTLLEQFGSQPVRDYGGRRLLYALAGKVRYRNVQLFSLGKQRKEHAEQ